MVVFHFAGFYLLFIVSCGLLVVLLWYRRLHLRNRRAAFIQWDAYLENVRQSLRNFVALEEVLRPYFEGEDRKVSEPGFQLHEVIQEEVEQLRRQLDAFSSFEDFLFSSAPIDWRPFPAVAEHLSALVSLAGDTVELSREGADAPRRSLKTMESSLGALESKNNTIRDGMHDLAGRFSELSEIWESQDEFGRARGFVQAERYAARLMSELQGNLPVEEVEKKLAETDGERELLREQVGRSGLSEADRERLEGQYEWVLQQHRWWHLQLRLKHQDVLLNECSGKIEELASSDARERFEHWLDSLSSREEIDTLHDKIGDLSMEKRMAMRYAQMVIQKQPALESMGRMLSQLEGMNGGSRDDIEAMKAALSEMGSVLSGSSLANDQLRYYEDALQKEREDRRGLKSEVIKLRGQVEEHENDLKLERTKFEQTLKIMENALEKATMEKCELEEGLGELKVSYEKLRDQMTRRV